MTHAEPPTRALPRCCRCAGEPSAPFDQCIDLGSLRLYLCGACWSSLAEWIFNGVSHSKARVG